MAGLDKLEVDLAGRPLLARTLDAIAAARTVERIVVVVRPDRTAAVAAAPWLPSRTVAVVPGGSRRQESVAAGVAALERIDGERIVADRVVLIHDGARPFVEPALVDAVAHAAAVHGAAIPVVPVADTVKRVSGMRVVETVDRSDLAVAQTPQGVRRGLLAAAYRQHPPEGDWTWTDEAALLEAARIPVHVVPGDSRNRKVTVPADLDWAAESLGTDRTPGCRHTVGLGTDRHPFGPGSPLILGGVAIEGAPRLHGHSDGDVALHAVADALLGGAGLGDLGRLFPPGPATPRGIASTELLAEVVRRVREAGLRPRWLDLTIVGRRPWLEVHLPVMRSVIAGLCGLPVEQVSVKASTGNLDGMEGAGRGMSALAIVLLEADAHEGPRR